jgi:hypothetical protein
MLKNPRFWISALIIVGAAVLVALGRVGGDAFLAFVAGILARFGADKATRKAAPEDASTGPMVRSLLPLALVGTLGMSGCCGSSARCYLATALDATGAASEIGLPAIQKACEPKVKACPRDKPVEACEAYQKCASAVNGWLVGMNAVRKSLSTANETLQGLGVN